MLFSIFIIGIGMVSPARLNEEKESPAPTLVRSNEVFSIKCAEKVGVKCGDEVYDSIFKSADAHQSISSECCKNLVQMGRKCHDTLVEVVVSTSEFAATKSIAVPKSVDVWNQCAEAVDVLASSPY